MKTYLNVDGMGQNWKYRRRRKQSVGYIFSKVRENGILRARGDTSPWKKGMPGNKEGRVGAEAPGLLLSVQEKTTGPKCAACVKAHETKSRFVPDLTAVSTSRRHIFFINQSEMFRSIPWGSVSLGPLHPHPTSIERRGNVQDISFDPKEDVLA